MATDIMLDDEDGNQVTVRANILKTEGSDFLLDSPARRKQTKEGDVRRALVHDQNDGLTLNFNGDYPGGITLTNASSITPRHMESKFTSNLVVRGGIEFELEVLGFGGPRGMTSIPTKQPVDLGEIINKLLTGLHNSKVELDDLKARVAALEKGT